MAKLPFNNIDKALLDPEEEDIEMEPDTEEEGPEEEDEDESEDEGEDEYELEDALAELPFNANLAEVLDEKLAHKIVSDLDNLVRIDDDSRDEWKKQYEDGLVLLGLTYEERTEPFDGASGVTHPILNEAVTQFQAQAYKELLPAGGPVRTTIIGRVTPEREAQAERVKTFMNYQITQVMEEFDPDYDQMLYYVGYGGSAFKKVYYDGALGRATSPYILPKDLIVPYEARDLTTADRITHVIRYSPHEMRRQQLSGFYADIDLGKPSLAQTDDIQEKTDRITGIEQTSESEQFVVHEVHCYLDLEGYEDKDEDGEETGLALPYIVSYDVNSRKLLSIRRNWDEMDPEKKRKNYFVHYKFLPGMGFYGFGLVHVLGNLSRSSTSVLRQLIDAGTLSNLPAGFKTRGLRIEDQTPIQPGEWRDVDAPGGDLQQSLLPLPYKEPSATLFQLLGFCIGAAEKFIGTTDLGMGESNQELPVGTTIALLERGSRVMSAVHKRLHYAQMQELKMLARVLAESLPAEYPYEVSGGDAKVMAQDFDDRIDVIPVSDPNIFSMTQRIALAQQELQLAQQAPQMHNLYEAYRRMYIALGVTDIDLLLPPPPEPQPESPALENARSLIIPSGGQALKAFPEQDHLAHMNAHIAFIKLPIVVTSPAVYGVLLSHIMEHLSLAAQQQVVINMQQQGLMGIQFTKEQMEVEVSKVETKMIQELLPQLMPQQGPDPLVQLQQQNLQLKAQELQQKAQTDQARQQIDLAKLRTKASIDQQRIQSQEDTAQLRANVALERVRSNFMR